MKALLQALRAGGCPCSPKSDFLSLWVINFSDKLMGKWLALAMLGCGTVFAAEPQKPVWHSIGWPISFVAVSNHPAVFRATDEKVFTPLLPPYVLHDPTRQARAETLQLTGIVPSASNTLVQLEGPPGKRYDVQSTPDLAGVVWRRIGSATIGEGGAAEFTDTCATNVQYYRIATPKAKADFIAAISLLLLGP